MKSSCLQLGVLATAMLMASAVQADVDLRAGSAAVVGPASVRFSDLRYDDTQLSVTANLSSNHTYTLSDVPIDTSAGHFNLNSSWVAITGPMSFRLFDVNLTSYDFSQDVQVNATLISDQLGVWREAEVVPSRFVLSGSWADGGWIPESYSCHGEGSSLPIEWVWVGAPAQVESFAIVVEDADEKDAGGDNYVHWNLFNLPPSVAQLAENEDVAAHGASVGWNSAGTQAWLPPCNGAQHRYYITVYALKSTIQSPATELSRAQFESAYGAIILNKGEMLRYYPE